MKKINSLLRYNDQQFTKFQVLKHLKSPESVDAYAPCYTWIWKKESALVVISDHLYKREKKKTKHINWTVLYKSPQRFLPPHPIPAEFNFQKWKQANSSTVKNAFLTYHLFSQVISAIKRQHINFILLDFNVHFGLNKNGRIKRELKYAAAIHWRL